MEKNRADMDVKCKSEKYLEKVLTGPPKILFWKKSNTVGYQKTQNFMLISEPLKKLQKNVQKKLYGNQFDEHE